MTCFFFKTGGFITDNITSVVSEDTGKSGTSSRCVNEQPDETTAPLRLRRAAFRHLPSNAFTASGYLVKANRLGIFVIFLLCSDACDQRTNGLNGDSGEVISSDLTFVSLGSLCEHVTD